MARRIHFFCVIVASVWTFSLSISLGIHSNTHQRNARPSRSFSLRRELNVYKHLNIRLRGGAPDDSSQAIPVTFEWAQAGSEGVKSVEVCGSWDGWASRHHLELDAARGSWIRSLDLPLGRYTYKYILDGSNWVCHPGSPSEADGQGNRNNWILVEEKMTELEHMVESKQRGGGGLRRQPSAATLRRVGASRNLMAHERSRRGPLAGVRAKLAGLLALLCGAAWVFRDEISRRISEATGPPPPPPRPTSPAGGRA